jgi:hypothetical protein
MSGPTNTTSAFSNRGLEAIYGLFNNNISYSSTNLPGISVPITLPSFVGNPNFTGLGLPDGAAQMVYAGLCRSLNNFVEFISDSTKHNLGVISKFRVMVVMADGSVFYDSFKGDMNTYDNFINLNLAQNHGTRVYIQKAFLSRDGTGTETKWSSTTKGLESYHAVRLGRSDTGVICAIVFSFSNSF